MKFVVIPVTVQDVARGTKLTRAWFHRVMTHVAGYWLDMSGGRESLEFRVLEWTELPYPLAVKKTWDQPTVAQKAREAAEARWGVDLAPYDRYIVVLDDGSTLGVTNPHPLVGALSATPALFQHEMGHVYAAGEADLDSPSGPIQYGDQFCIMGLEGGKFSYIEDACTFIDPSTHQKQTWWGASGPGMCAPYLEAAGWLDSGSPAVLADLTGPVRDTPGEALVELSALSGAPPPGWSGPPCVALVSGIADAGQRLFVEFRHRSGWDRGMPAADHSVGWVVAHVTSGTGHATTSVQVGARPARVGESMRLRQAPVRVDVVGTDAVRGTIMLRVAHDGWRPWGRLEGGQYNQPAGLAAVSRFDGNLEVFVTGQDGMVRVAWLDGSWHDWYVLGGAQFSQAAGLAVTSRQPSNMEVFAIGQDGVVRVTWFDGSWHDWYVLGGAQFNQGANLAVVSRSPDTMEVFATGQDGMIRVNWFADGAWHDWYVLGEAAFSQAARLTAAYRTSRTMDVFATGQDGLIRWAHWARD